MPIYEYRCADCEGHFERYVATVAASVASCPSCGSGSVKRMLSLFAMKSEGGPVASSMPASGGGGCCGGGCGCH